ncbi:uncharacterized protein LOC110447690 [Mizuhopecten yessoensis]|uniref:uncharacterized protein LOC110447690 n=1 Tax=Mizuhopecten yessoensis TaxID=6573 RepID=UPI000B459C51|nr:uncharacterized protein LOC110447690 [Mizuhopecten yessoensis]
MKGSPILCSLVTLAVLRVGASRGLQYDAYILLNPCGNEGNFTNTTYQLHVPDGITRVRLQEVHEKEIYNIIRQLMALQKNNTDLVIMSSELMKAFPVQLQQSFGKMEVISMSSLTNPPYSPLATSGQSVDGEDECSPCRENGSAHFEITMPINEHDWWYNHVLVIADAILKHLRWSSVYIFYEEKLQHLVDLLLDHWSENSITFNTFMVERMSDSDIVDILGSLKSASNVTKGMANLLVLCEDYFTNFLLHVASEYSEKHIRDSAIQHHTHWLLVLFSNDATGRRILNNITLDNVALIELETQDRIKQKTCHSIESILLADECTEHGIMTGTEFLKYTIARLFYDASITKRLKLS